MKICTSCHVAKMKDQFYVRCGKCKACTRETVKRNRLANIDKVRAYDRDRSKLPHRVEHISRTSREWRKKHPDRNRAQCSAGRAANKGLLVKPVFCACCGLIKRLEKHHPDYSRPLLVMWLCKPCHAIADKIRRKLEAS